MNSALATSEWLRALGDECHAAWVEGYFNARDVVIAMHHSIGQMICSNPTWQKHAKGNGAYYAALSELSGISESTLRREVQFYELYPDLSLMVADKALSWTKIVQKYLTDGSDEPRMTLHRLLSCPLEDLERGLRDDVMQWRAQGQDLLEQLTEPKGRKDE